MTTYFLHGLDSSGQGTKGAFFAGNFPQVRRPDFFGDLTDRLTQLQDMCGDDRDLTLIGSSFGGLMATCFAIDRPQQVARLILLAPALNFAAYVPPETLIEIPTLLVVGRHDVVTPPDPVLPLARRTFACLEEQLVDDDHMLHETFRRLPWHTLIPTP